MRICEIFSRNCILVYQIYSCALLLSAALFLMVTWACVYEMVVAQTSASTKDGLCEDLVLVHEEYMCTEHVVSTKLCVNLNTSD